MYEFNLNQHLCISVVNIIVFLSLTRFRNLLVNQRTTSGSGRVFHDSRQIIPLWPPPATTKCAIQNDLVDSIVFSSKTVAKHGFETLSEVKCPEIISENEQKEVTDHPRPGRGQ